MSTPVKKIAISLTPETLEKMDIFCKEMGLSRSGLISVSVNHYIQQSRMTTQLPMIAEQLKLIQEQIKADGARAELPEPAEPLT